MRDRGGARTRRSSCLRFGLRDLARKCRCFRMGGSYSAFKEVRLWDRRCRRFKLERLSFNVWQRAPPGWRAFRSIWGGWLKQPEVATRRGCRLPRACRLSFSVGGQFSYAIQKGATQGIKEFAPRRRRFVPQVGTNWGGREGGECARDLRCVHSRRGPNSVGRSGANRSARQRRSRPQKK